MRTALAHATGRRRSMMVLAVVLTLIAGYVDAIGYLRLGGIYVANMSGNSVAVGIHTGFGPFSTVLHRLLPIGAYVVGLLVTRIVLNLGGRRRARTVPGLCLAVESLLLILFIAVSNTNAGIVIAAIAMGIQAAAIVRFSGVTVHTAFVTGSLVKFAENAADALVCSSRNEDPRDRHAAVDAIWFGSIWLAYVAGAMVGAVAFSTLGAVVLWGASIVLFAVVLLDFSCPAILDNTAQED